MLKNDVQPVHSCDLSALDLDGTLFDPSGSISQVNLDAIQRAKDAGIEVVICSGRCRSEMTGQLNGLTVEGPIIIAGGAMIIESATGETVYRSLMERALVHRLVGFFEQESDHAVLLLKDCWSTGVDYLIVGDGQLDPASVWWFENMPVAVERVATIEDDPNPEHTVRVGTVGPSHAMRPLAEVVCGAFSSEVFVHHFPAIKGSGGGPGKLDGSVHLLEIFSPGTNKWTAIEALAEQRGVPVERVGAIGDEHNDRSMIEHAGLGIAMGNAIDSIKAVADRITERNDEDGVARAIDRILAGEWSGSID